jgi:hypothetical protein
MDRVRAHGCHTNGSVTCKYCGSPISAGDWTNKTTRHFQRYLRIHQRRCEHASDDSRRIFVEQGRWPNRSRRKKS